MRTFAAMMTCLLLAPAWASPAKSADKPVPLICLTQQQAAQVYKGRKLKYRLVKGEACWYAGRTRDKTEFAVTPRAPSGEQPKVLATPMAKADVERVSPVATAQAVARDPTYEDLIEDAFLALTGRSEAEIERMTFVKMWDEIMKDAKGGQ